MATTTKCESCGAESATSDYCDSCGAPMAPTKAMPAPAPGAAPAAVAEVCPNCQAARDGADTFCESCGLDFATGQMPAAPAAPGPGPTGAPSGWVAVITADENYFESNQVEAGSAQGLTFPVGAMAREVPLVGDEVIIGRRSESKGFFPAVDLSEGTSDPGVSRRHVILRRQVDNSWTMVDEMSTNGTYLNGSPAPLENNLVLAVHDGDYLLVGAFTRITFRNDGVTP